MSKHTRNGWRKCEQSYGDRETFVLAKVLKTNSIAVRVGVEIKCLVHDAWRMRSNIRQNALTFSGGLCQLPMKDRFWFAQAFIERIFTIISQSIDCFECNGVIAERCILFSFNAFPSKSQTQIYFNQFINQSGTGINFELNRSFSSITSKNLASICVNRWMRLASLSRVRVSVSVCVC